MSIYNEVLGSSAAYQSAQKLNEFADQVAGIRDAFQITPEASQLNLLT